MQGDMTIEQRIARIEKHLGIEQPGVSESAADTTESATQYEDYWCTTCRLKIVVSHDPTKNSHLPRMQYRHDGNLIPLPKEEKKDDAATWWQG